MSTSFTTIETIIEVAASKQVPLYFTYVKPDQLAEAVELRVLIPDADDPIRISKAGDRTVIGHDPKRDGARQFRLDRIREATV